MSYSRFCLREMITHKELVFQKMGKYELLAETYMAFLAKARDSHPQNPLPSLQFYSEQGRRGECGKGLT